MLEQQARGDYVEADRLRQKAIIDKRKWEQAYLTWMENSHQEDQLNLEKQYFANIEQSNKQWTHTIEEYMNSRN